MSKKFLTPVAPPSLSSDPATGVTGAIYFNTTVNKLKVYNGTSWVELSQSSDLSTLSIQQVNTAGNPTETYNNITTLQFDEDSGFDVTNPTAGTAKVAMNSTFKYWEVDGVQKLTATGLDTVNFISGEGIAITADSATNPQSITISASGASSTASFIESRSEAPTSPTAGRVYFDTQEQTIKVYNGYVWYDAGGPREIIDHTHYAGEGLVRDAWYGEYVVDDYVFIDGGSSTTVYSNDIIDGGSSNG